MSRIIPALNEVGQNLWAAFILMTGAVLAVISVGHPDLKEVASTVVGGALILFRSATPSAATAVTAVTVTPPKQ